jgi:alkylation response protein AidB-like acyl-CoA dehydrogenase
LYTTHGHLPEEHRMVYEMCRKFADEELAPNAREWDQKHQFPKDAVGKLVRLRCVACLRACVVRRHV